MEKLLKDLREIADKAEAADKLHWAKSIREAAGKFGNLLRAAAEMRDAVDALPQDKIIPLATAQCDLADAIAGVNTSIPADLQCEMVWCRDNGNTGPRTHELLVKLCQVIVIDENGIKPKNPTGTTTETGSFAWLQA